VTNAGGARFKFVQVGKTNYGIAENGAGTFLTLSEGGKLLSNKYHPLQKESNEDFGGEVLARVLAFSNGMSKRLVMRDPVQDMYADREYLVAALSKAYRPTYPVDKIVVIAGGASEPKTARLKISTAGEVTLKPYVNRSGGSTLIIDETYI